MAPFSSDLRGVGWLRFFSEVGGFVGVGRAGGNSDLLSLNHTVTYGMVL